MNDTSAGPAAKAAAGGASPAKKRKAPGRLECDLGIVLGLLGLAASRLGQLWIAFDVFAQFTVQFAVIAVAFLIGRLLPRARLISAFVLIVLGLVGIGLWPVVASSNAMRLGQPAEGERELKVASFNTFYENPSIDGVRREIERLDADVITLIESGPNMLPMLKQLAQRYPYQANCFRIDFCHMAILSKLPIAVSDARIAWDGPPVIMAKLDPEVGGLTVIGVHTSRFPHARAQFAQVNGLAAFLNTLPGPKLVMGDFNATPFSRIVTALTGQTGLIRQTGLPSWPTRLELPQVAIDHIFSSPGIRLLETERIGEPAGSDHYPVSVSLAVPRG